MAMQTLIHADIFFFVTTIVIVLVAIVLIVILIYIVIIMADIREISRFVRKETGEIAEDMKDIHTEIREKMRNMRDGGSPLRTMFSFFRWFADKRRRAKRRKAKKDSSEDSDE